MAGIGNLRRDLEAEKRTLESKKAKLVAAKRKLSITELEKKI